LLLLLKIAGQRPLFYPNGSGGGGEGRNRIVFARLWIGMGANLTRGPGRGQGYWAAQKSGNSADCGIPYYR
jgi:hypothetical protein